MIKNTLLWTALVTPMKQDGRIDLEDLGSLARRQESAGNGLLLIGSTGEGLALSDDEKLTVVEHVVGMNLSVPVMAGVGGFNLDSQKEWVRTCNNLGVDAFLMVAPLYSKPGPAGLAGWFTALMDQAGKPCMIYNIPGRTGIRVSPSVFASLNSHPNFWSIKEAGGSIHEFQLIREAVPEKMLFSGDDGLLPYFAVNGCNGLVSVASNVWPEATRLYMERCLAHETDTLFPIWRRAAETLFSASNPIPAKRLLVEKGWIKSPALRMPLTPGDLGSADDLLEMDREIDAWFAAGRGR